MKLDKNSTKQQYTNTMPRLSNYSKQKIYNEKGNKLNKLDKEKEKLISWIVKCKVK